MINYQQHVMTFKAIRIGLILLTLIGCRLEPAPEESCRELREAMKELAGGREIRDLAPLVSEGSQYQKTIACYYAVHFRRDGRLDQPNLVHEGVAVILYEEQKDFDEFWANQPKAEAVQGQIPAKDKFPMIVISDTGETRSEYFKNRALRVKYRLRRGYILLFLYRGDFEKGEFSAEARNFAEALHRRFLPADAEGLE